MDINFLGHIEGLKFTEKAVIVVASEQRHGYKKNDGTFVRDEILSFSFIFKTYFKSYIASHFSKGMLVKIKGTMLPYAKDHQGKTIDGYTLLGQTIDIATYQTNNARVEKKMIDASAMSDAQPDLESFIESDF